MKTKLKDIQLFSLDGHTVLQISKLVRLASACEVAPLRLSDPLIVAKALSYAVIANDKESDQLYISILSSLKEIHDLDVDEVKAELLEVAQSNVTVA